MCFLLNKLLKTSNTVYIFQIGNLEMYSVHCSDIVTSYFGLIQWHILHETNHIWNNRRPRSSFSACCDVVVYNHCGKCLSVLCVCLCAVHCMLQLFRQICLSFSRSCRLSLTSPCQSTATTIYDRFAQWSSDRHCRRRRRQHHYYCLNFTTFFSLEAWTVCTQQLGTLCSMFLQTECPYYECGEFLIGQLYW